ncbi:MAG: 5-(carboxyamino)imidazole ribonucleotide mutase [Christensenellales bacterium]|jgi:5-(carboxyamino)imidazole ribonucleotide mutase
MKKIAILMGSDSDLPVARKAADMLAAFGVPFVVRVCSAHRTPDVVRDFAVSARDNGFGAIICVAGMSAHLAGAVAANTTLPVVGVPVASKDLGGLDALLSTVQMPSGIPVATVAVDGAKNAALLCIQMLAITDSTLARRLQDDREEQTQSARQKDQDVSAQFPQ